MGIGVRDEEEEWKEVKMRKRRHRKRNESVKRKSGDRWDLKADAVEELCLPAISLPMA